MAHLKSQDAARAEVLAEALAELGLKAPVGHDAIRHAFRQRLKQTHPDLNGGGDTRLRRLIMARDFLMSDGKIMAQMTDFTAHSRVINAPDDGAMTLTITLAQAIFGGLALREVPALEFSHADEPLTSLTQTKTLRVTLPCGLRHGEKVRLPTQGAACADRLFKINIETDATCRVWGDDIWMTAHLENRLLLHGGGTTIDTPHGPQAIRIGKAVAQGASLCLKGKGLPATDCVAAGHLHIRLEAMPDRVRPAMQVLGEFRQRWAS